MVTAHFPSAQMDTPFISYIPETEGHRSDQVAFGVLGSLGTPHSTCSPLGRGFAAVCVISQCLDSTPAPFCIHRTRKPQQLTDWILLVGTLGLSMFLMKNFKML